MDAIDLSQPESVPQLFAAAWNQYDAGKLAELFVEDAAFVNVTGLWWHNRAAIFKAHDCGLKVIFNRSHLEVVSTKVHYLSETIAFVHARMQLTDQTPLNSELQPQTRKTLFLFVLKKEADRWMCHAAQNTEVLDGMETFVRTPDGRVEAVNYGQFKKSEP